MYEPVEPTSQKLAESRHVVNSLLEQRKLWKKATMALAIGFEIVMFILLFVFMDFGDRLYHFLLVGFLFTYLPTITLLWSNSIRFEHLFYRLIAELKYNEPLNTDNK